MPGAQARNAAFSRGSFFRLGERDTTKKTHDLFEPPPGATYAPLEARQTTPA